MILSISDENECERDPPPCPYHCRNTAGSYDCGCGDGFTVGFDGVTCQGKNKTH